MPAGGRALFLYAAPRRYIASILAGENSLRELHALAPTIAPSAWPGGSMTFAQPRNDADLAAAAWACEMTALEAAAAAMPNAHMLWIDFDQMLDDVGDSLRRIARGFGFEASPDELRSARHQPADEALFEGARI